MCDDVALIVRAEDFYEPRHQTLFAHMLALHEQGRRVDPTLLIDALKSAGEFESIGGPPREETDYQHVRPQD